MSRSWPSASRRARRAVAAVEFALLLPFLCFAFLATVDFCRVFYYSVTVSNCARNGALMGSRYASTPTDFLQYTSIQGAAQAAARADASNLNPQLLNVTSSTDSTSNPTRVDVTVSYPFTMITQYPGIPRQTNLSRTVRISVLPPTPRFN
jgi:Flp pilus assembly protein TadG